MKKRRSKQAYSSVDFNINEGTSLNMSQRSSNNDRQQTNNDRQQADNDPVLLSCLFYIRTTGEYTFRNELPQLGSNQDKRWFSLTHTSNTGTYLLTVEPKSDKLNQLNDEESAVMYIKTLGNLLNRLYHPYIEPINKLHILFTQKLIVIIRQYQRSGSLRDLIHNVKPTDAYQVK